MNWLLEPILYILALLRATVSTGCFWQKQLLCLPFWWVNPSGSRFANLIVCLWVVEVRRRRLRLYKLSCFAIALSLPIWLCVYAGAKFIIKVDGANDVHLWFKPFFLLATNGWLLFCSPHWVIVPISWEQLEEATPHTVDLSHKDVFSSSKSWSLKYKDSSRNLLE